MLRTLSGLFARPGALATSVALHVGAVVAGGHGLSAGSEPSTNSVVPAEIEVQLFDTLPAEVAPSTRGEESPPPVAALRAHGAGHRHAYPIAPDHDAHPHDPSLVHLVGRRPPDAPRADTPGNAAPSVTPSEAPSSEAPLRFVLGAAGRATVGATASTEPTFATGAPNGPGTGAFDSAVVPESAVDQPARLLSTVPVVYPEGARAAGMEAEVPLELVVNGDGRVTSARHLAEQGLGLAEAAVRAVRGYRFTPARRAGRAVSVRMRWTVTFRLE